MRTFLSLLVLSLAGLAAFSAQEMQTCEIRIELVDADSKKVVPGLMQIRDAEGKLVSPKQLLSRGFGLDPKSEIHDWSVIVSPARFSLPRGKYTIRAFSGLETELSEKPIELKASAESHSIELRRFFHARNQGYRSANTHLHLKKLSREQADRYLIEVPLADGLDVVFLSYLERAVDDLEYTSNKYTRADLEHLAHHGAKFGNGEEHRHNFGAQNQGYGHVMLLNIPELIQPVSIGPGISKKGTDGIPLRVGIEKARSFGSTIIWCHNQWGLEDIPNWVMGRLHANNIFDGGTHGSFKHSFYRYLNAGLRVPFSTGTDWFMYDFSRVYVPSQRELTAEEWLSVLAAGKSWITNGPLLEFTVNDKSPGDTLELPSPGTIQVSMRCKGRVDFQRLELVRNGQVVETTSSRRVDGHFEAEKSLALSLDGPCWLALRTPPPPVKDDPELQQPVPKNELGCDLFGHTSAIFVRVAGKGNFDVGAAQELLDEMHESRTFIQTHSIFADATERERVLSTYEEAIEILRGRIQAAK